MTAVQLPSFEPGSPEWDEQRRRAVGGSEIAAILGIGKWESRFSLWHRKAGTLGPQGDNDQMEWGRRLEPVILAKYADDHPDAVIGRAGTFAHPERSWQLANVDAFVGEPDGPDGIVECKTQRDDFDHLWGEPGTDEIPVYYRAQCLWYMDVLDAPWCDIAVLIAGSDYREYRVQYDIDEARMMRGAAVEFLQSLEANERPDIDAHQATYQAVRELHPDIEPQSIDLPADLARNYCNARHELKRAEETALLQRSLVADAMGTAQYAKFLGQTIARRQTKGASLPFVVAGDNPLTFEEVPA